MSTMHKWWFNGFVVVRLPRIVIVPYVVFLSRLATTSFLELVLMMMRQIKENLLKMLVYHVFSKRYIGMELSINVNLKSWFSTDNGSVKTINTRYRWVLLQFGGDEAVHLCEQAQAAVCPDQYQLAMDLLRLEYDLKSLKSPKKCTGLSQGGISYTYPDDNRRTVATGNSWYVHFKHTSNLIASLTRTLEMISDYWGRYHMSDQF